MSLNPQQTFDAWAADYDRVVQQSAVDESYPFAGYGRVLDTIVRQAQVRPGAAILDLGTGTGKLAARFVAAGCSVLGTDFSPEMLARARANVPAAQFVPVDFFGDWPPELNTRFDGIVSSYVFHEFDLENKIALLRRLQRDCLKPDGRIVIGDFMFPPAAARAAARERWAAAWDEEHYWIVAEVLPALQAAGFSAAYEPISVCGGLIVIR
ncbi:MAG TPA: class I SAM-dependent methyltransferase [Phototrophicaceae bacterium]|nr:class I SAM-dependent methyltransferase [Phototrophicaceae bacterium]